MEITKVIDLNSKRNRELHEIFNCEVVAFENERGSSILSEKIFFLMT